MVVKGLKNLRAGNFNSVDYAWQADGTVIITLAKRGEGKIYKLHIKDLYGPNEEVLSEEVIEV